MQFKKTFLKMKETQELYEGTTASDIAGYTPSLDQDNLFSIKDINGMLTVLEPDELQKVGEEIMELLYEPEYDEYDEYDDEYDDDEYDESENTDTYVSERQFFKSKKRDINRAKKKDKATKRKEAKARKKFYKQNKAKIKRKQKLYRKKTKRQPNKVKRHRN